MLVLQRKSEIISPSPIKVSNSFWPVYMYIPLHTSNLHASELGNDKKKKKKKTKWKIQNQMIFHFSFNLGKIIEFKIL